MKTSKILLSLLCTLTIVLGIFTQQVNAEPRNSTVILHPSTGVMPTGVKVKVGDLIDGHPVISIVGYDITVELEKYDVNNDTFRLPWPEEIWEGVKMQYNPQTYVVADSGPGKNPGASIILLNGSNTCYYYNLGKGTTSGDSEVPENYLWNFELKFDANGGIDAPATLSFGTNDKYTKSHVFEIPLVEPNYADHTFLGWAETPNATEPKYKPGGNYRVMQTVDGYNGGFVSKTLYAVWKDNSSTVIKTYTLTYQFVSGTEGMSLPQEVMDLLPNSTTAKEGETVKAAELNVTNVAVTNGIWSFKGWNPEEYVNLDGDKKFVGTWVFEYVEADNEPPVISAEDVTLYVGDTFDPFKDITAIDKEDGDLTTKIEIIENTVDTTKAGEYTVSYRVTDSGGLSTTKTIKVTVKNKMINIDEPVVVPLTGDNSNLLMWTVTMTVSFVAIIVTMICGKKVKKI